MEFALILIGMILVMSGYWNTLGQLGAAIKGDFTGPNNFLYWLAALVIIGSIGYINDPNVQRVSRVFMGLLILVILMVASKRGLVQQFSSTLGQVTGGPNVASGASSPPIAAQTGTQVGQPLGIGQAAAPFTQQGFAGPFQPGSLTQGLY